ncbi:MAG: glycosyltransferase family 2 protein [Ginsengibacter sp.]
MIKDPDIPLVTVGIPTYNRPQGLERTLKCILGQTYPHLEIIISDNCSTDPAVLPILEKYALLDKRVTFYIQEKNLSIVPNFQFLLDNASGEYFMWAADDDFWDTNFIEVCVNGMLAHNDVVLCMTDLKIVGANGTETSGKLNRGFMQNGLLVRNFNFVKSTGETKYFFCGLYKTALVKNIPFDNSWGGDHLFIFGALSKGKFLYLPGQSDFYYYRGGSSTNMDRVRKAFNIKSKYYFFEAYILKYTTYQFTFRHLSFFEKIALFVTNWFGLICNEDFILYYIFIKKPVKTLFKNLKRK